MNSAKQQPTARSVLAFVAINDPGRKDLVKMLIVGIEGQPEDMPNSLDALSLSPGPTEMTKTIAPGAEHLIRDSEESPTFGLHWRNYMWWQTNAAEPDVATYHDRGIYGKGEEELTLIIRRELATSDLTVHVLKGTETEGRRSSESGSTLPKAMLV